MRGKGVSRYYVYGVIVHMMIFLALIYDSNQLPHNLSYLIEPVGTKIYVGNLNFDTTVDTLKEAFEAYGEVKDCFIPSDYDGNPRGFALVTMDDENALQAIEGLGGTELDGRTLNVNKSLPKGTKAVSQREC